MTTLKDALAARTHEGELYERLDKGRVHCYACGHDCRIPDGALGVFDSELAHHPRPASGRKAVVEPETRRRAVNAS